MYSYEDRMRAVELYIKLGKRVGPTIRQLGYPTKNALKGWHREFEHRLDLPMGYARREPKYSLEQKQAALKQYIALDRCIAATIRALGYPSRGTLSDWIREAFPQSRQAIVGSVRRPKYPDSMKLAGVREQCSRPGSAQAIAEKLGRVNTNFLNGVDGRHCRAWKSHPNSLRVSNTAYRPNAVT